MNQPEGMSIGGLFSQLAQEARDLARKEVALAREEVAQKATFMGKEAAAMAAAALIVYAGFLVLLIAAVAGLATEWPVWASALTVGVVTIILGAILAVACKMAARRSKPALDRTIHSLKEDRDMIREQVS